MTTLAATYRIQLSRDFRLSDVRSLAPYLARLGVSHVYLSPILKARSGSSHGYDVVDPLKLNPELGSEDELAALADELHSHRMGLILDIVPNHMATGHQNPYWEEVLTHGPCSRFATWFDIDWGSPDAARPQRIFLPVLGDRLAQVIGRGELRLVYRGGLFRIEYFEQSFPVDPGTLPFVLDRALVDPTGALPDEQSEARPLADIVARLRALPPRHRPEPRLGALRESEAADALLALGSLGRDRPTVRRRLESAVAAFDPRNGDARPLSRLLAGQAYRLAYWRRAAREINYRRFFTISHLVAVRMEDPTVFAATHARILAWIRAGIIDGLRIDHIDGLFDPAAYLARLQTAISPLRPDSDSEFPLFVEKILAREERLPAEWPVAGTTGYDFLAEVEDLFIAPAGLEAIEETYRRFTRRTISFAETVLRSKRKVLDEQLGAESRRLARQLQRIAERRAPGTAPGLNELREALVETMTCLPVYRTYANPRQAAHRSADREVLASALASTRARGRAAPAALEFLAEIVQLGGRAALAQPELEERVRFVGRFQQTTTSAAAKGVEDTAFYLHVPLASRNEVGGDPGAPLLDAKATLHAANARRARKPSGGLLCTSTHDSKRSADLRARLDVISELPQLWRERLRRWHLMNRVHRRRVRGRFAPDRNTEYLLYQTLVGVWPLESGGSVPNDLRARVAAYMQKAAREAKTQTSWVDPDAEFEAALQSFVQGILAPASADFMADLAGFVRTIGRAGLWNSVSRILIQLCAPGTPDIYQGDELWNLSLVDPDNRRPVDFTRRIKLLEELSRPLGQARRDALVAELVESPEDDRLKLFVLHRALQARRDKQRLFSEGDYQPLTARGRAAAQLFAFARQRANEAAIVVVPRLASSLDPQSSAPPVGTGVWSDTQLVLPAGLAAGGWINALTGVTFVPPTGPAPPALLVGDLLADFPVALLLAA